MIGAVSSRYNHCLIAPVFPSSTTPRRRNAQQSYATETKKLAGSRFCTPTLQPMSDTRPPNPIVPMPSLLTSPMIDASSCASRPSEVRQRHRQRVLRVHVFAAAPLEDQLDLDVLALPLLEVDDRRSGAEVGAGVLAGARS